MSTSGGQSWTTISNSPEDTVRITTRKTKEPGQPNGVILGAVSTTRLPYPQTKVFDLLRDERHRSQMDALSNGNSLNEVAHISNVVNESTSTTSGANNSGCLLIMGMQVLASTISSAKINLSSVTIINNHLCNTLYQIEAALCSTNNYLVGSCYETTTNAPTKQ
ncbi:putative homeobox-leucine zipper protein HDG5 isoform X1 [Sesbania bispinosa]|nr:putative homeobox-leucine zipper protein HDG5 isoform X1 [Sesbania bispinosa]